MALDPNNKLLDGAGLRTYTELLKGKFDDVDTQINSITTTIEGIQGDIDGITTSISNIEGDINGITSTIADDEAALLTTIQ